MDDEVDRLVIGVRADTAGFARDIVAMKTGMEDGLGRGAERAGRMIETSLVQAIRTGKFGFDDLARVALRALDQIADAVIRAGVRNILGGDDRRPLGGLGGILTQSLGLPGRATGGPVSPGAAYLVGERGPELFVPTQSGRIAPSASGGSREIKVSIAVQAGAGEAPRALTRSSRQVARAVARAIAQAEE